MPKIPALDMSQQISLDVPRAKGRFDTAGMQGEALGNVGKGLQDLGKGVGSALRDLEVKRDKAAISEFGDNTSRQFRRETDEFIKTLRQNSSGSDHQDYAKSVEDFMATRQEELLSGTQNTAAKDYFLKKTTMYMDAQLKDSQSYEFTSRAKFNVGNRLKSIDDTSNQFYDDPNPFKAANELLLMKNEIDLQKNLQFTPEQAESMKDAASTKFRLSVLEGMTRDGLPGIITENMPRAQKEANIKAFLNGEMDGTKELFANMGPEEKIRYENKMLSLVDRQEGTRDAETRIIARNAADLLTSGERLQGHQMNEINGAFSRVQAMEPGPEREILLKGLVNAKKVGGIVDHAKMMTNAEIAKLDIDKVIGNSGLITSHSDSAAKVQLAQALDKMRKEREHDGKAYIDKNFPDLASDPIKAMEMQKQLGILHPRVMSKEESVAESLKIMESMTAVDKAAKLDEFLGKKGPAGFQALSEMAKDNPDFDKSYIHAAYFNSTLSKESIISNAARKGAISKEYDDKFPGFKSVLSSEIESALALPTNVLNKSQQTELSAALRESVELDVKNRLLSNTSAPRSQIIQDSIKRIVGDNFDFVQESKANLIIPKDLKVSKKTVSAYLDGSLSDEAITKYGVEKSRYSFPGTQQEFNDQVRKNAHWASNGSQDGMVLLYTNPKTGITAPLADNNGTRIEVKYSAMTQDQRTLDNLNSFTGHATRDYFKKTPLGQSLNPSTPRKPSGE